MEQQLNNPTLSDLQSYIIIKKNYVMALQKRLLYIRKGFALKTEQEKNEVEISMHETIFKINRANISIYETQSRFEDNFNKFLFDLDELGKCYEKTLELAKKHQGDSEGIKHLLYYANWKFINENICEKIQFHANLKEAIYQHLKSKTNE